MSIRTMSMTKLDDIGCLPNLFIVADGMGGHKAGDTASRYTVETLVELLKESEGKDPLATIDNNIKLVNSLLLRKAGESEEYNGMGTTLVVASIFDNTLRVANVGDSRLYVIQDGIPPGHQRSFPGTGNGENGRDQRSGSTESSG